MPLEEFYIAPYWFWTLVHFPSPLPASFCWHLQRLFFHHWWHLQRPFFRHWWLALYSFSSSPGTGKGNGSVVGSLSFLLFVSWNHTERPEAVILKAVQSWRILEDARLLNQENNSTEEAIIGNSCSWHFVHFFKPPTGIQRKLPLKKNPMTLSSVIRAIKSKW